MFIKGGYSVLHGDRVGSVVEIDGTQGDRTKLTGEMSLTNQLMSGRLNVPLFANKAALQVDQRKTYFNFTDWSAEYDNKNDFIKSNYDYSDLNTKFNTTFKWEMNFLLVIYRAMITIHPFLRERMAHLK